MNTNLYVDDDELMIDISSKIIFYYHVININHVIYSSIKY